MTLTRKSDTPSRKECGIPEYWLKLEVAQKVLDVKGLTALAHKVAGHKHDADQMYDRLRNPPALRPRDMAFWNELAAQYCNPGTRGSDLVDAEDINLYIRFWKSENHTHARQAVDSYYKKHPELASGSIATQDPPPGQEFKDRISLGRVRDIESLADGFRKGRIDQKHHYMDPESTNEWGKLIEGESYRTYDACKLALQCLLGTDEWKETLSTGRFSTVVMLAGAGAPTKDRLLLRNLIKQPGVQEPINYYLVDISLWMLRGSALWLSRNSHTIDGFESVVVTPLHEDILAMTEEHDRWFHQDGKNTIFAITGNTIGNLSEEAFFISLNRAARQDDLLIVSAGTRDLADSDLTQNLMDDYGNEDVRQWIRPVLKRVLAEAGVPEPPIKVEPLPGVVAKVSDVPESLSAILTVDINGKPLILHFSTRYESPKLVAFAAGFGWQEVCQVTASPLDPSYKQFLFRRK